MNGLCECGCGQKTWIATINNSGKGWVKGQPVRFVHGHATRQAAHHKWLGDLALGQTKRKRAHTLYSLDGVTCEQCGIAPAVDRHHKDADTGNNSPDNIAFLCRKCHMIADGRLAALLVPPHYIAPMRPCIDCDELAKPLRRGRCHKCNEYLRRHGTQRPKEIRPITGEARHSSKLSDKQVADLLQLKASGVSPTELAAQFGISYSYVFHVCKGRGASFFGQGLPPE